MRTEIRDLLLVQAIAEEGSMTKAATRLFATQPALSYQLKTLEDRLGTSLFERGGRGMTPTPRGLRLLESARRVLHELSEAEADLDALAAGRTGTLRIAAECYTSYHWLPRALAVFGEAHPGVEVRIVPEATEDPLPHLLDGRLDLALVTKVDGFARDLRLEPLFEAEMIALVPAGHPWAAQVFASADDVATEHVILYQHYDRNRRPPRPLPLPEGATPAKLTTLPMTTEAVVEMVRARMGVTVMATWAAASYLAAGGLASVRLTEAGLWRTWYAATQPSTGPYVQTFVERLRNLDPRIWLPSSLRPGGNGVSQARHGAEQPSCDQAN